MPELSSSPQSFANSSSALRWGSVNFFGTSTLSLTYKSPAAPPRRFGIPWPFNLSRVPACVPAGTLRAVFLPVIVFISICPPVDLWYAIKQIDKNSEDWQKTPEEFKQKVAQTASKVMKLYEVKGDFETEINNLPFDENEAKLITGFLMHQKLSDLIFTIENSSKSKVNSDTYYYINNMNFIDYTKKYIIHDNENIDDIAYDTSLYSISYFISG